MNVTIIGAGNVGTHLAIGLSHSGVRIHQVFSRSEARAKTLASAVGSGAIASLNDIDSSADVVLIAVKDGAIGDVGQSLRAVISNETIVAHTAGSIASDVLSDLERFGVFYPLQTFTVGRTVEWRKVPILVTATEERTVAELVKLARLLSGNVMEITDRQRLVLHLCATMANNFSNQMFALAERIASDHELDFDLLKPLIEETASKVQTLSPFHAQTGAAVRGDEVTMRKHLALLENNPEIAKIYSEISASIHDLHSKP